MTAGPSARAAIEILEQDAVTGYGSMTKAKERVGWDRLGRRMFGIAERVVEGDSDAGCALLC